MITFREFILSEVGTSTGSVATFAQPFLGGTVGRTFPSTITYGKKGKVFKHPQVIETSEDLQSFPPNLAYYHDKTYKPKKVGYINPFGTLGDKGEFTVAKQQPEITDSQGNMIKQNGAIVGKINFKTLEQKMKEKKNEATEPLDPKRGFNARAMQGKHKAGPMKDRREKRPGNRSQQQEKAREDQK